MFYWLVDEHSYYICTRKFHIENDFIYRMSAVNNNDVPISKLADIPITNIRMYDHVNYFNNRKCQYNTDIIQFTTTLCYLYAL